MGVLPVVKEVSALDSRRIVSDIKVLCVRGTGAVVIIIA